MSDWEVSDSESDFSDSEVVLTGRKALLATNGHATVSAAPKSSKSTQEHCTNTTTASTDEEFKNRQRVLLLSSRGITSRHRHLLSDLALLLPHAKKDAKFDSKSNLGLLNELADLHSCNNVMYFESRKHQDLYLWLSKSPLGPCVKFQVQNIHTMMELNMTGNCLKGSRPLLSFDPAFDSDATGAEWKLMKEMLVHMFGTPKGHRKSKPFYDHVFSFSIVDNRIWFRNYQVVRDDTAVATTAGAASGEDGTSLVEIGPRFVLNPIRIFNGSFGGAVLYENTQYVSPNALRALHKRMKGGKYAARVDAQQGLKMKMEHNKLPKTDMDVVDEVFKQ